MAGFAHFPVRPRSYRNVNLSILNRLECVRGQTLRGRPIPRRRMELEGLTARGGDLHTGLQQHVPLLLSESLTTPSRTSPGASLLQRHLTPRRH